MTTVKKEKIEVMNFSGLLTKISAVLFFMFILLKPYYLKPSGSIGTADICLAAAAAVMLAAEILRISALMRRVNNENAGSRSSLSEIFNICAGELLYRRDIALYAFIVIAAVINAVYCIRLGSQEYTKYTIYWLYNGAAVWTLRKLRYSDHHLSSKLAVLLEIDIVLQFIIMLSGHGRYFVEYWGAVRYMGSFNDPNQLAFFMFVSMLLIYSLKAGDTEKKKFRGYDSAEGRVSYNESWGMSKVCLLRNSEKIDSFHDSEATDQKPAASEKVIGYIRHAVCISAIIIIIKTKSTGIMLGVAVFAFAVWCRWIWEAMQSGRISKKLIAAVVIICAVCAAGLLICIWPPVDFDVKNVEYNTLTRIQEKLWKLSQGGIGGFLIDRGSGKLAAFPQYMLFGAGEGGFDRFALPGQEINEIHCSIMSILFCYGIIPTLFMIKWTADSFKNKNGRQFCACLALIAESMTLINYRQPMFWFLLM